MPIPITKALVASSTRPIAPGDSAKAVSITRPVKAINGPAHKALRSRAPDHPDTVNVPIVQPSEMMMLRKLINTGETPCTTCSKSGRNSDTEVCVMP